jgi:hypothetical protein
VAARNARGHRTLSAGPRQRAAPRSRRRPPKWGGAQAWGCFAHPRLPHCSILFSQTNRPSLAAFDDRGYPVFLIVLSANYMKLGPGCGSRVQGTSRTALVGDRNDAWRPKGFRHDQARPIGARDPIAAFPLSAKARGTEERPQGPLSDRGSETVRRRAIPSSKANTNLTNDQHAPGGDGRIAVPSSRGIIACCDELAGDGTISGG